MGWVMVTGASKLKVAFFLLQKGISAKRMIRSYSIRLKNRIPQGKASFPKGSKSTALF